MTAFMSRTELEITEAEDIRLIRYYNLPDGTPGLLMLRGNKSFINLCEYDTGWLLLTQKADSLYLEHPDICADDHTRDILEARKNTRCSERFDFLTKTKPYSEKILSYGSKGFSESFTEYILKEIYKSMETGFSLTEIKGYRENFSIRCKVNGREKNLPCELVTSGNEYTYHFGNLFEHTHSGKVRVRYDFGSIEITADTGTEKVMQHRYCYDFRKQTLVRRAFEGTQIIFSGEQPFDLPAAEMSPEMTVICDTEKNNYNGYILPWGENIFYCNDDRSGEFIAENRNQRVIQIYRRYPCDNVIDEIRVTHEIYERDGKLLIQSELDDRRCGRGSEPALGGYFYRHTDTFGLTGIGDDLSGMTGAQLLEKYLYRQKEKGNF